MRRRKQGIGSGRWIGPAARTTTRQYGLSKKQQARTLRRLAAGLAPRKVTTPGGARVANAAGVPQQAYRKDDQSRRYRGVRTDHAAAASAAAHRKAAYARATAHAIVAVHGPNMVTEDVNIRTWMVRWGRGSPRSPPA